MIFRSSTILAALAAAFLGLGIASTAPAKQPVVKQPAAKASKSKAVKKAPKGANPFNGFASGGNLPVNITSDSLELHQEERKTIFSGHVVASKGTSTLCTQTLTVYYEGDADKAAKTPDTAKGEAASAPAKESAPAQANAIKKLEASDGVVVTSQDQVAVGKAGVFDMQDRKATLTGGVTLSQGPNIIRGDSLDVDLATNIAKVRTRKKGRISSTFQNSKKAATPAAISCTSVAKAGAQ